MTDAQQLFNYAQRQFNDLTAEVERHFDHVADSLRDGFSKIKPPHIGRAAPPPPPPPTTLQAISRWISKHRALTAAIAAFFITGSVGMVVYAQTRHVRKRRRARRSPSGARTDVVVVVGAVAHPLTSAIYLDLERRGFVVYVVANNLDDELYIRSQSRADVIPLTLDLVDPYTAQDQLARFQHLLSREHTAFEGAEPHRLRLVGVVLVPDTQTSSTSRIEDIATEEWSDAFNAKVLHPISVTQHLLPTILTHRANTLLITPSVTPALSLPGHSIETTVTAALRGYISSLSSELSTEHLSFTHLRLGHIDLPSLTARQRREGIPAPRIRPTPIRHLHDVVFDTLVASRPAGVRYVGRGSLTYEMIGRWIPPRFIAWMMNANAVSVQRQKRRNHERSSSGGSSGNDMVGSAGSLTWEKVDEEVPGAAA